MRLIYILLILGLVMVGCTQNYGFQNSSNEAVKNESMEPINDTAPVCAGPVCGEDNITYATDCDAELSNIVIAHMGECMFNCTDSDGGINTETFGVVTKGSNKSSDYCSEGKLVEYTCLENTIVSTNVTCPAGMECQEGLCALPPPQPVTQPGCEGPAKPDSFIKQTVSATGKSYVEQYTDYCIEFSTVKDYYCEADKVKNVNSPCPPGYGCSLGQCEKQVLTCSDSDNGQDLLVRGRTVVVKGLLNTFDKWDECYDDGKVTEYSCLEDGSATYADILCPSGLKCANGKCIKSTCKETDAGIDIYKFGITTDTVTKKESHDYCTGDHSITEYYCYGDDVDSVDKSCGPGYICDNDRCVEGEIS